jgi:hypothetical protein
MPTIKFFGRVLPPRMRLTQKNLPTIHWEEKQTGLVIDATVTINDSAVEVTCDSNRYKSEEEIGMVYMRALDMARTTVDCFSFANGYGVTVMLESLIGPDGIQRDILVHEPRLQAMVTAFNTSDGKSFDKAFEIILTDTLAFMAMNDLIVAISLPHHGPINCTRAIESLRNSMAPGMKRNPAWEFMRQSLNVSEDYLQFVTKESELPRHGHRVGGTQENFTECINRAWTVMNRFLEFRMRGSQTLPLTEFPIL